MKKVIKATSITMLWIGASEFLRNQLLFVETWRTHYTNNGMLFPEKPINGMVWMLWSLTLAGCIVFLRKKLTRNETFVIGWVMAFVLMWLTIGNLSVLPYALLWFAIPLSLLEVYVAVRIAEKCSK
jgi:hypothetical protein